jgi:hypothetical protein
VAAYKQLLTDWNGDGNTCSKFSAIYGGLYKVPILIPILSLPILSLPILSLPVLSLPILSPVLPH